MRPLAIECLSHALWRDAASVVLVVVFGLRGIDVLADAENGGITEDGKGRRRGLLDGEKITFVANLLAGQDDGGEIEPSVAIGVGNRLGKFMGQSAVGGVDELTVWSARPDLAAVHVLEWLDGVEDVADVSEGHAVVVGAERKTVRFVGRIASGSGGGEALVLARWQKDVKNVPVTGLAAEQGGGMDDCANVVVSQRDGGRSVAESKFIAEDVAIVCVAADILIRDAREAASAEIVKERCGIAPASGDRARAVRQKKNRMRLGEGDHSATEVGKVCGEAVLVGSARASKG